jgi:hypothetical protein
LPLPSQEWCRIVDAALTNPNASPVRKEEYIAVGQTHQHSNNGATSDVRFGGPGCVKTCTSRECAELFSLFSSFDGDCQSGSSVIQRNRDKPSTLKFDDGVFTQAESKPEKLNASMFSAVHPTTDIAKILRHVRFVPIADIRPLA